MRRYVPLTARLVIILAALSCSCGKETSSGEPTVKNPAGKTPARPPDNTSVAAPEPAPPSPYLDPTSADGKKWAEHTGGVRFVLGYESGHALARKTGRPAMYFVTTTWCKYCRLMAKNNFDDGEVKKLLEAFVCVLVDGDAEERRARLFGAPGFPHVVFTAHDGERLADASGAQSVQRFRAMIRKATAARG